MVNTKLSLLSNGIELFDGQKRNKSTQLKIIIPEKCEIIPEKSDRIVQRFVIGRKALIGTTNSPIRKSSKTILLIGSIGVGKTSLLNAMVNYCYEVSLIGY